jgi:hypothetical protein
MSVPISSSSSSNRLSSGARPPYFPPNQPLNFRHQSPYIRLNYSPRSEPASSRPSRSFSISNVDSFLGDPALIHPFLAGLSKDRNTSRDGESDLGAAALHLAIRCASGAPLCTISAPFLFFFSRNSLAPPFSQVHLAECDSPPSIGNDRAPSSCLTRSRRRRQSTSRTREC